MGKNLVLIQIAHMIGLCDDLDLAILGCSQQSCLPFSILSIVCDSYATLLSSHVV